MVFRTTACKNSAVGLLGIVYIGIKMGISIISSTEFKIVFIFHLFGLIRELRRDVFVCAFLLYLFVYLYNYSSNNIIEARNDLGILLML